VHSTLFDNDPTGQDGVVRCVVQDVHSSLEPSKDQPREIRGSEWARDSTDSLRIEGDAPLVILLNNMRQRVSSIGANRQCAHINSRNLLPVLLSRVSLSCELFNAGALRNPQTAR
jgi:hypothetical protein